MHLRDPIFDLAEEVILYATINFSNVFAHMIKMTLAQAARILGLNAAIADTSFTGISIDTRTIQPGNLYVAIPGERVDGHDYVLEAMQKGAAAVLVNHAVTADLPQLIVEDTTTALGKL